MLALRARAPSQEAPFQDLADARYDAPTSANQNSPEPNLAIGVERLIGRTWYGHNESMAVPKIKVTYSLDVDSVRDLEELARQWGVSKSEALRRAIQREARRQPNRVAEALQALDNLQASVRASGIDLAQWERDLKSERRLTSERLGSQSR